MDKSEQLINYSFNLITNGGNAKSLALKGLQTAQEGKYNEARQLVQDAREELHKTHQVHMDFIQREANGEQYNMTILAIHAQDHFTSAIIILDLAEHLITLYEKTTN